MPPFQLDVVSQMVRKMVERWTKRNTKVMSPIHLPVELWIEIGSYLRHDDLRSLSMVTRSFRGMFQVTISSVITISYPNDAYTGLKQLLNTPSLHPFIHDLQFSLIGHPHPKPSELKTRRLAQQLFYKRPLTSILINLHTLYLDGQNLSRSQASTLLECQSLRNLFLNHVIVPLPLRRIPNRIPIQHLNLGGRTIVDEEILDIVANSLISFECSSTSTGNILRLLFPVLRTFVIHSRRSLRFSHEEFQNFFFFNPTITYLGIHFVFWEQDFDPSVLPNLKTLSGDDQSVGLVLHPSRHIQHLKFTSLPHRIILDDIKILPRIPYHSIETLEWNLLCTYLLESKLMRRFTRLRELRIRLACGHVESSKCPRLFGTMIEAESPTLEKLIFISTLFSFTMQETATIQSFYVSSNFPSLKYVQFQRASPIGRTGRERIEVEFTWMVPRKEPMRSGATQSRRFTEK